MVLSKLHFNENAFLDGAHDLMKGGELVVALADRASIRPLAHRSLETGDAHKVLAWCCFL